MSEVALKELKEKTDLSYSVLVKRLKEFGIYPFLMGGRKWVEGDEAERFLREWDLPDELQCQFVRAYGLRLARNIRFIYCTVEGFDGKHLVLVPSHLRNRLIGKNFMVEVIRDKEGVSFRHERFAKAASLR